MITQSQKINGSAWILLGLTVSLQAQEAFNERNVGAVERRLINGAETQVEWETEVTMEDGSVQVAQRGYTELDPGLTTGMMDNGKRVRLSSSWMTKLEPRPYRPNKRFSSSPLSISAAQLKSIHLRE